MAPKPQHALTIQSKVGLLNVIYSPIKICIKGLPFHTFNGIWDTGATNTVITQEVVDKLGLKPIGITRVNTASEQNKETTQYIVDIYLKDDLCIENVVVTLGKLGGNFHCLIGMDIITIGDFSLTNMDGKTTMSFRVPSCHEVDYVKNMNLGTIHKNIPPGLPGSKFAAAKKKRRK